MPRFFVTSSQINGDTVTILGEDAHHISRSLRCAVGDSVTVCDMSRTEYTCALTDFLPDRVLAKILSVASCSTEPPVRITLYQALPKGDKLDTVIQKAVECGASRIVPFESERCVVRLKSDSEGRKTERRLRIAHEAAKQCGRGILPEVGETVPFADMLRLAGTADTVFFCYEGDGTAPIGTLLRNTCLPQGGEIALIIGSEGGFSVREAELARSMGFLMTGLGPRILRTETAPLFALACISCHFELSETANNTIKNCEKKQFPIAIYPKSV
ncbi:MAG: 16S rRNA (uracil(1498)-N(3))-methyltransferase [Clostridia bacterium]|nr:16S rRNA (uracil(1498)-N(3))-methyltransferase [Clostridia bacterium]